MGSANTGKVNSRTPAPAAGTIASRRASHCHGALSAACCCVSAMSVAAANALEQGMHVLHRNGITDPRGPLEHGLPGFLHENAVDHADHLTRRRPKHRAAAVARIGDGVELKHIVSITHALQLQRGEFAGVTGLANDRGNRGDNTQMRYRIQAEYRTDGETGEGHGL